jgi:hypothetical protein
MWVFYKFPTLLMASISPRLPYVFRDSFSQVSILTALCSRWDLLSRAFVFASEVVGVKTRHIER